MAFDWDQRVWQRQQRAPEWGALVDVAARDRDPKHGEGRCSAEGRDCRGQIVAAYAQHCEGQATIAVLLRCDSGSREPQSRRARFFHHIQERHLSGATSESRARRCASHLPQMPAALLALRRRGG